MARRGKYGAKKSLGCIDCGEWFTLEKGVKNPLMCECGGIIQEYRSRYEAKVASTSTKEMRESYESVKIPFVQPAEKRTYTPDWVLHVDREFSREVGYDVYSCIEAGILNASKRKKLKILQADGHEIKLLLVSDKAPGIKSASKWCERNGFDYHISAAGEVPERWLK